jgi:hypothetical protein
MNQWKTPALGRVINGKFLSWKGFPKEFSVAVGKLQY